MPLLVAGLAIPTTLAGVYLVAQVTELSIYVQNVATMLGLALAIDYSLFMVSRFREELRKGRDVEHRRRDHRRDERQGRDVLRAGRRDRAQSGLLLFEPAALRSFGIGGALVVASSVLYALTFLPAVARHARPARQLPRHRRAPRPRPPAARPARGRRRGRRPRVALGADGPLGHGPAGRGPDPDARLPALPRHAVPAPEPGHPGRVGPARGHREPRGRRSRLRDDFRRPARRSPIIILADGRRLADRRRQRPADPRLRDGGRRRRRRRPGRGPVRRAQGSADRRRPRRRRASPPCSPRHATSCRRSSRPASTSSRTTYIRGVDRPPRRDQPARRRSARPAPRSSRPSAAIAVDGVTAQVGGLAAQGQDFMTQPVGDDPVTRSP